MQYRVVGGEVTAVVASDLWCVCVWGGGVMGGGGGVGVCVWGGCEGEE